MIGQNTGTIRIPTTVTTTTTTMDTRETEPIHQVITTITIIIIMIITPFKVIKIITQQIMVIRVIETHITQTPTVIVRETPTIITMNVIITVSYTHLDVYKRQTVHNTIPVMENVKVVFFPLKMCIRDSFFASPRLW